MSAGSRGSRPHRAHASPSLGAERLWQLLEERPFVRALGALTGNQAMQQVKAGLEAIYLSGWQVAADANNAGADVSRPVALPVLVGAGGRPPHQQDAAARRPDRRARGRRRATYWFAPIVADAEAGFGGPLNAFELMKAMIEAGAAGVHFEDQLASEKKCGHLGGKVLVPTRTFIRTLNAARLAADVCGIDTLVIARTDAHSATLITSDVDERDAPASPASARPRASSASSRATAIRSSTPSPAASPTRPMPTWSGGRRPSRTSARRASSPRRSTGSFPGKLLAYNCSPSFNWRAKLDARRDRELPGADRRHGLQVPVRDAGRLPRPEPVDVRARLGLRASAAWRAYCELQEREFAAEATGFTAVRHQREVGTGYFDAVAMAISAGESSTIAMAGSTEAEQFDELGRQVAAE